MAVRTTTYGADKNILVASENAYTLPCIIGGTADSVVKAGTPLSGDLKNRDSAFSKDVATPNCVLLHDVKIEAGASSGNGVIVVEGMVDLLKLESDVVAMISSTVETALAGKIYFIKGAK